MVALGQPRDILDQMSLQCLFQPLDQIFLGGRLHQPPESLKVECSSDDRGGGESLVARFRQPVQALSDDVADSQRQPQTGRFERRECHHGAVLFLKQRKHFANKEGIPVGVVLNRVYQVRIYTAAAVFAAAVFFDKPADFGSFQPAKRYSRKSRSLGKPAQRLSNRIVPFDLYIPIGPDYHKIAIFNLSGDELEE